MPKNESKLRLVIVCPACGGNGSVASVALTQARLVRSDFAVRIISDSFDSTIQLPPDIVPLRIEPPAFRQLRRFAHVPREVAFAIWAKRALWRENIRSPIDFVLFHGHVPAAIAAETLAQASIPSGLVTHGDIADRPKGTYDARLTKLYTWATPRAYRKMSLIAALSPHMTEVAMRNGCDQAKIKLLPNGISPMDIGLNGDFVPAPSSCGRMIPRLLFVGRLSVEKGVDVLVHAHRILADQGTPFHLKLVGDGPLEAELRDLVRRIGSQDMVEFSGRVPRAALGEVYRSSHIVCVPSRSDTLPTVVLEAMAAGRPVVGSAVGGIPFMIESGKTGLVVPPDNPSALAEALRQFVDNPELVATMGRAGLERCATRFTWEACAAEFGAAIKETIATRRSP